MTDPDPLEQARIEQHLALLSEAEFADLVTRTRAPATDHDRTSRRREVSTPGDPETLKLLRRILGEAEPEPVSGPNIVPNEGRTTGKPGITPEQYTADFIKRVTGAIPAAAEQLPEQEYRP